MSSNNNRRAEWRHNATIAAGAGAGAAICVGAVTFLGGSVGGLEARELLDALLPTSRLLCSSVLTVTATILALMLTILSFTNNLKKDLADEHFERVRTIALCDSLIFGAAAMLFLVHCVPITESKDIPSWWYPAIYYFILSSAALITGAVIGMVALLYFAVRDFVNIVSERVEAES